MGWMLLVGALLVLLVMPFVGADSRDGTDWRRPAGRYDLVGGPLTARGPVAALLARRRQGWGGDR